MEPRIGDALYIFDLRRYCHAVNPLAETPVIKRRPKQLDFLGGIFLSREHEEHEILFKRTLRALRVLGLFTSCS